MEVLEQAVKDAQSKADEQERALGDMVSTAALSYITLQHPETSADKIIKGAKEEHPEVKEALQMACKLYHTLTQDSIHLLQRQHLGLARHQRAPSHQGMPRTQTS